MQCPLKRQHFMKKLHKAHDSRRSNKDAGIEGKEEEKF